MHPPAGSWVASPTSAQDGPTTRTGRAADRVLLQIAARSTARWLLAALADAVRRLDKAA